MRFKQFEIRKPTLLGREPSEEYYKYNFDLVKWSKSNESCFSIASIVWNQKEYEFDFRSVGTRYLQEREDGLEEWLVS